MPELPDSSDKPKSVIKPARLERLPEILKRADAGYALTPGEVKLLADIVRQYDIS